MTSKRVRNLFKFGRAKSQSTTDLTEWSKSDEKLMKAVEHGEAKKVFSILSKKAMVPTKLGPRGHSIFHVACALGNIQIVEMLIKETDDVNDFTIQGNTCLQLAAAKGHVQVVQRLLQAGAEIDKRDSNNMTALHHAVAGLHHDCIQALLSKGADPRSTEKGGKTSLFYAAHRGDVSICKLLVDKGVDVNSGDNMQVTPLMIAAKEGNRDVCEFLLKRGANPNHPDREGRVAEHYAVASGHPELKDVFANAPPQASWVLNTLQIETVESRTSKAECNVLEEAAIHVQDAVTSVTCLTQDASPGTQHPADAVQSLTSSDAETMSYSEDEAPPKSVKDTSSFPTEQIAAFTKKAKAYKELESEHEQLSEEYHTLSIENLRLRDKLEFLQQQMNGKFEQDSKRIPQEIQNEIINLKNLLEEEKEKCKELEIKLRIKTGDNTEALTMEVPDSDSWQDSDEDLFDGKKSKTEGAMNDKQMMVLLRSQILTLRQENDQLKDKLQLLPNGYRESSPYLFSEGDKARASAEVLNSNQTPEVKQKIAELEAEKQLIKTELLKMKESTMAQHLNGALSQEEILKKNKKLQEEIELLKNRVTTLETDKSELQKTVQTLEEEKAAIPSDKLAVLNSHKLMQEVTFDEDGFVDGQDMTKEEFLQAQNEQVKGQCKLLTEELAKLRTTFDAILKAGDNLQADYDQLQAEKDKLHDQLEAVSREKEEVVKENEFLLSDGNALHEDLKKIVHELEKMQEKYKKISAEKEELQRQASAITIAGKVGEVARLLEEREKLQLQLGELEKTSGRLSHDNAILLEEVQSLQESNVALTAERDSLQAELEETEAILSQHDVLTQEYNQLEIDFNELLKDKDRLEQDLLTKGNSMVPELNDKMHGYETLVEERDILIAERDQLELTIQELSRENALLEEELQSAQSKIISLEANSHSTGTDSLSSQSKNAAHWIRTIEELSKEKSELEEELLNAQEQMTAMEVQMEATSKGQGQAVGDDEDVESLHASLSHLERTVTELSLENAHLEDELTSCREQLDEAQIALENRSAVENHNLSSADLAMQTLKQEKQDLAEMVESLQEKIEELLQNTSKLKNDVESLQNEKEGLLQTVAKFEERNTELSDKLVLMKSQLLGLEGEAGDSTQNSRTVTMRISMNGTETNDKGSVEQEQEIKFLRAQLGHLQQQLTELEQTHRNTISIYRTHLLSAVQGHMDPAVKEALYNIIEMRSMEQYC